MHLVLLIASNGNDSYEMKPLDMIEKPLYITFCQMEYELKKS